MIMLLHKPTGVSSNRFIRHYAFAHKIAKIGHTGTLDPLASGLLLVTTDDDTKLISYLDQGFKEYVATAQLGLISNTYDSEGTITNGTKPTVTKIQLLAALAQFRNQKTQLPPHFSAKKVQGKRAYQLARQEVVFKLEPVAIEIKAITLLKFDHDLVTFKVTVSRGTYIRSIIDDLGQNLGCGAIMIALCRTRIGQLTAARLNIPISPREVVALPILTIDQFALKKLYNGIKLHNLKAPPREVMLFYDDQVVGIGIIDQNGLTSKKLFGKLITKLLQKKEKNMYKMVAFDIDETILPQGQKALSANILQAFKSLKANKFVTAFSTGREFVSIGDLINTPHIDYFVGANGTFIYDMNKKEILYENCVQYKDYKLLETFCLDRNISISVMSHDSVYFNDKEKYKFNWFWSQFYDLIKPLSDPSIAKARIHQVTVRTKDLEAKRIVIEFIKTIPGLRVNTIWVNGIFVSAPGVSKASGLAKLGAILKIDLAQIVAFGDGENDIEMIEEVGMGVAVGNATAEIKAVANKVTDTVHNEGAIKALKELNLI